MKYKIGNKLKVKKGCEGECVTYRISKNATHIKITDVDDNCNYSYGIFNGKKKLDTCYDCLKDEHLEPLEKTWDTLEEGDVVVSKTGGQREVLAIKGRVIILSIHNDFNSCSYHSFTKEDLIANGYTIKNSTPESDTVEVSMQEIAKERNIPVEKLRIKE
jgi:hypothetical protein